MINEFDFIDGKAAFAASRYFSLHIEFLEESAGGTAFDIVFDRSDEKMGSATMAG